MQKQATLFLPRLLKGAFVFLVGATFAGSPRRACGQEFLKPGWQFSPVTSPKGVAYSLDGSLIGVGTGAGVCIYSAATQLPRAGIAVTSGSVLSFKFSPDGETLAIIKTDGAELWNFRTGKLLGDLSANGTTISSIAFSGDGQTMAVGGQRLDTTTQVVSGLLEEWNVATMSRTLALSTKTSSIHSVAFTRDEKSLVAGGTRNQAGSVELWNASTGKLRRRFDPSDLKTVWSVVLPSNGNTVVAFGDTASEGAIATWQTTGVMQSELKGNLAKGPGLELSPEGTQFALSGSTPGTDRGQATSSGWVSLWNTSDLKNPVTTWGMGWSAGNTAFSSDGTKLLALGTSASWYGSGMSGLNMPSGSFFSSWNTTSLSGSGTQMIQQLFWGPDAAYIQPTFSPSGKLVIAGGANYAAAGHTRQNGVIDVWDTETGHLVAALATEVARDSLVGAFSPNDRWLVVSGSSSLPSGVQIWDLKTGKLAASLGSNIVRGQVTFSPNGKLLAIAGSLQTGTSIVQVIEMATGTVVATLASEANAGIASLAFSKDNRTLAVGGSHSNGSTSQVTTGVLELWDVSTGVRTASLATKESAVSGVTFWPNATMLVAAGSWRASASSVPTGIIETWDASSLELLGSLPLYSGTSSVAATRFSEAGNRLYAVTSGGPGIVQVLDPVHNKLLGYFNSPSLGSFALSNDATLAVSGSNYFGLNIQTVPPLVSVPIKSVKFGQGNIAPYSSVIGTVTIVDPAPAGGITLGVQATAPVSSPVHLSSNYVTIPEGQTTATFSVSCSSASVPTPITITALSGQHSRTGTFTVQPTTLSGLKLSAARVEGGEGVTGTVTLAYPGAMGVSNISLKSDSSLVECPSTVFVFGPNASATFAVKTHAVTSTQTVTITAKMGTMTKTVTLTLKPPAH